MLLGGVPVKKTFEIKQIDNPICVTVDGDIKHCNSSKNVLPNKSLEKRSLQGSF